MKEEKIQENIKQLQNDISYSFKQTSEVIDIIYRKAIKDADSEKTNVTASPLKDTTKNDIIVHVLKLNIRPHTFCTFNFVHCDWE